MDSLYRFYDCYAEARRQTGVKDTTVCGDTGRVLSVENKGQSPFSATDNLVMVLAVLYKSP